VTDASPPPRVAAVTRLALTDVRNHAATLFEAPLGPVALTGPNGVGKTAVLEALSLLAPGRGLRGAALSEIARADGAGGFGIAARLAVGDATPIDLGTGTTAAAPERRLVRLNGAPTPVSVLGEALALAWLTPAMDRLLAESAGARRRFLDRLVLALEPGHGRHAARYEAAMRERSRLLADGPRAADPRWLAALEAQMGEHGAALTSGRLGLLDALTGPLAATPAPFPAARLELDDPGLGTDALAEAFARRRTADAAAGRATFGPHRAELTAWHLPSGQRAARASTGELKALLVAVLLAHAEVVAAHRGQRPILLLDEVVAHLDADRREALLARLPALGQVWMTGTDAALIAGPGITPLTLTPGPVAPG
jgi:DNA replication and repair protein RecF